MTTQTNFSVETIVNRSSDLVFNEVDGDIIMLSIKTSKFYGSETVGCRIWQLINEPVSIGSICDTLMGEFEIDRATCEQEVIAFVQRMSDEELIEARVA